MWDDDDVSFGHRLRDLDVEQIRSLLREGPLRFVEANVGSPLRWVPLAGCFAYWKAVAPNIASRGRVCLDDHPGGFAFFASEWRGRASERLVLLEKQH